MSVMLKPTFHIEAWAVMVVTFRECSAKSVDVQAHMLVAYTFLCRDLNLDA